MGSAFTACVTCASQNDSQNKKANPEIPNKMSRMAPYIDKDQRQYEQEFIKMDQKGIVMDENLFLIEKEEFELGIVHRSIGAMTYRDKDKRLGTGSGVLISNDLVLTSAHNIFDKIQKQQYSELRFYLGAHGDTDDYLEIEKVKYPSEFMTCLSKQKHQYDYALLKLKPKNGKVVDYDKFLPLSPACEICLMEKQPQLQIYGYPTSEGENYKPLDKRGKKRRLNQYGLARQDRIVGIYGCNIRYKINTNSGQSGCPIIAEGNIIGIHNGAGPQKKLYNIGRTLTTDSLTNLRQWEKELGGHPFQINNKLCLHMQSLIADKRIFNRGDSDKPLQNQKKINGEEKLSLNSKDLTSINLNEYINLKQIELGDNKLANIDVRNHIHLNKLWLHKNQIEVIDLSKNINLINLSLHSNKLHTIDLTKNTKLIQLYLWNNQLKAINLSKNISLTKLYLYQNQLTEIDISKNISLTILSLNQNQLTEIDISKNINLTILYLGGNKLTEINLYSNPKIVKLIVWENNMRSIAFWYSPALSLEGGDERTLNLSNQNAKSCEVTLFHNQNNSQPCEKFRDYLQDEYSGTKVWSGNNYKTLVNAYNCKYSFGQKAV